jgi:hypothetical protein
MKDRIEASNQPASNTKIMLGTYMDIAGGEKIIESSDCQE